MSDSYKSLYLASAAEQKKAAVDAKRRVKEQQVATNEANIKAQAVWTQAEARIAKANEAWMTHSEQDTYLGQAQNLGASLVDGTNRMGTWVAQSPFIVAADAAIGQVDERGRQLDYESKQRVLTNEERLYMDSVPEYVKGKSLNPAHHLTRNQLMARYHKETAKAQAIKKKMSGWTEGIVNQQNRSVLHRDLKETFAENGRQAFADSETAWNKGDKGEAIWAATKGIAALTYHGAGDLLDNPAATFEYIAENAPQLAVGAISKPLMAATNMSYGAEIYSEGLTAARKEKGRALTDAEKTEVLAWSMGAVALEQVTDVAILNTITKAPGASKLTQAVAAKVGNNIVKKAVNNGVTRTGLATFNSAIREAVAETGQTSIESGFSKLKDPDLEETFIGGAIGMGAGGGLGGGGRAVTETITAVNKYKEQRDTGPQDPLHNSKATKVVAAEAAETGNVDNLLDRKNRKTYAPETAAAVLWGRSKNPDLTEAERAEASTKLAEVIKAQKENVENAQLDWDEIQPEKIAQYEEMLNDEDIPDSTKDLIKEQINDAKQLGRKEVARRRRTLDIETGRLEEIESLEEFSGKMDSLPTLLANQEAAVDGDTNAINAMINAMIVNPGDSEASLIDESVLDAIEENATPEQKKVIQRTRATQRQFTAAQAAANQARGLSGVQEDIITKGRNGFKSIKQYLRETAQALLDDNAPLATALYSSLGDFAQDHQFKQQKLQEAIGAARRSGKTAYLVKDFSSEDGGWKVTTTKPKSWDRPGNGGLVVKPNKLNQAAKILSAIKAENAAINAGLAQIEASIVLKTGTPVANPLSTVEASSPEAEPQGDTPKEVGVVRPDDPPPEEGTTSEKPTKTGPKDNSKTSEPKAKVKPTKPKATEKVVKSPTNLDVKDLAEEAYKRSRENQDDGGSAAEITWDAATSLNNGESWESVKASLRETIDQYGYMEYENGAYYALEILEEIFESGDESVNPTAEESAPTEAPKTVSPQPKKDFAALPDYTPGQRTLRYAGIGSRNTPPEVQKAMKQVADYLQGLGYTLLSGGAKGADSAFEAGSGDAKEVFLAKDATPETIDIAKEIHPAPERLTEYPLKLMARNTFQVFGSELDSPVDFVLAWTPDGAESSADRSRKTGGTGQAIDMASRKGIPVINLANPDWEQRINELVENSPVEPKADEQSELEAEATTQEDTDTTSGGEMAQVREALDQVNWGPIAADRSGQACYVCAKQVTKILTELGIPNEQYDTSVLQTNEKGEKAKGDHQIVVAEIDGEVYTLDIPQRYMVYRSDGNIEIKKGTDLDALSVEIRPFTDFTKNYVPGPYDFATPLAEIPSFRDIKYYRQFKERAQKTLSELQSGATKISKKRAEKRAAFVQRLLDLITELEGNPPVEESATPQEEVTESNGLTEEAFDAVDFKASTDENPLIAEARDAVREALLALNFQFVDNSAAPDVTDIERIASKILQGTSNDDPAFIKDAATALSYALFVELGATERMKVTREWIETALFDWLMTGEPPKDKSKQKVWQKVLEVYNRLLAYFKSDEYQTVLNKLQTTIDNIRSGATDQFSFAPAEGFAALSFQKEMDNNKGAAEVLIAMTASGIDYTLTGSVAYADQVPVYRKEGKPLHDVDILLAEEDIEAAAEVLQTGDFGKGGVLYSFKPGGKTVTGLAVVPKGYEVRNVKNGFIPNVWRSYEVYDVETDEKVGSYSYQQDSHETFEGIAGVTVDLMSETERSGPEQKFTLDGVEHTLTVASYVHGFVAKLGMLRYKDIKDFINVVPPTVQEEVTERDETDEELARLLEEQPTETAEPTEVLFDLDDDGPPPIDSGDPGYDQDSGGISLDELTDYSEDLPDDTNVRQDQDQDEEIEQEVDEEVVAELEKGTEDGTSRVFTEEVDEDLPENEQNIVGRDFKQTAGRGESVKPLAKFKNFLSLFYSDKLETASTAAALYQRLGALNKGELTPAQVNLIGVFKDFWEDALDIVAVNLNNKKANIAPEFRYKNLVSFFGDENGEYEENVKSAIIVAAFSLLAEEGGPYQANDPRAIAGILGIAEDDLEREHYLDFAWVGTREQLVIQGLGAKVAQILGITAKSKDEGTESQGILEASMGAHALALLQSMNLVTRHFVNNPALPHIQNDSEGSKGQAFIIFKPAPTETSPVFPGSLKAHAANANTGSLLNNLFGFESRVKFPAIKKPGKRFNQKGIKGTLQGIPASLRKILGIAQQREWGFDSEMMSLVEAFDDQNLLTIGGVAQDDGFTHIVNGPEEQSKRDSLLRDVSNVKDFFTTQSINPFWLIPKVWSPQRVGFDNNVADPQQSKFSRAVMGLLSNKKEFNPNEAGGLHTEFLLAVGQGLGIKTEEVTQQKALDKTLKELEEPDVAAAIAALRGFKETGKLTPEQQQTIAQVANSREEWHTLQVLNAYVDYKDAQILGDTEFSTNLMYEVDGVANGPALTHILLGLGARFAEETGFYSKDSKYKNLVEFKEAGNAYDMYELVADQLNTAMYVGDEQRDAVYYFAGQLIENNRVAKKGRKLVKNPITTILFGSGLEKAVDKITNEFVDSYYTKISSSAREGGLPEVNRTVAQFNLLLEHNGVPKKAQLPMFETLEEALTTKLPFNLAVRAAKQFKNVVGDKLAKQLKFNFQSIMDIRKSYNQGASMAFQRYETVFNAAREAMIERLMDEGKIDYYHPKIRESVTYQDESGRTRKKSVLRGEDTDKRIARRDLNKAEMAQLRKELQGIAPILHTLRSRMENDLSTGIDVGTITQEITELGSYQQVVKFGQPISDTVNNFDKGVKSKKARAMREALGEPGVRAIILAVHSTDSYIASEAYKQLKALGIHDALGLALGDTVEGAIALNKATFKAMLNYSAGLEILDMVDRSLNNMDSVLANLPSNVREQVEADLGNITVRSGKEFIYADAALRDDIAVMALEAEESKLHHMQEWSTIDQYSHEFGFYELTPNDYKLIEQRLKDVGGVRGSIKSIQEANDKKWKEIIAEDDRKKAQDKQNEDAANIEVLSYRNTKVADRPTVATVYSDIGTVDEPIAAEFTARGERFFIVRAKEGVNKNKFRAVHTSGLGVGIAGTKIDDVADRAIEIILGATEKRFKQAFEKANEKANTTDSKPKKTRLEELVEATEKKDAEARARKAAKEAAKEAKAEAEQTPPRTFIEVSEAGKPHAPQNDKLNALLKGGKHTTARTFIPALKKLIKENKELSAKERKFQVTLLDNIESLIDKDLAIRYVQPDSPLDPKYDAGIGTLTGAAWYHEVLSGDTSHNIVFLGDQFKAAWVTTDVALHELVHAVTTASIAEYLGADLAELSGEELKKAKAVQDLVRLRAEVKNFLASDERLQELMANDPRLQATFNYAVTNVRELVAVAGSDAMFQKEVLARLDTSAWAKQKTGLSKLINSLLKLVGLSESDSHVNGLGVFVTRTAEIMSNNKAGPHPQVESSKNRDINQAVNPHTTPEDRFTTQQIFDALDKLGSVSPAQEEQLSVLLAEISHKVMHKYGVLAQEAYDNAPSTSLDEYIDAVRTGEKPFSSRASALLPVTEQEAFVLEEIQAVLEIALGKDGKDGDRIGRSLAKKLWREARTAIPNAEALYPGDWNQASESAKDSYKKQWDLIFVPVSEADGKSNYLEQFMAVAMVYPPLRLAMSKTRLGSSDTARDRSSNWYQQLKQVFSQILNRFAYWATNTDRGQRSDEAIQRVAYRLAVIERRKRDRLSKDRNKVSTHLEATTKKITEGVRGAINKGAEGNLLKNSRFKTVAGTAALVSKITDDKFLQVVSKWEEIRDGVTKDKLSITGSVVNEAKGETDGNRVFMNLLGMANKLEQQRKTTMINFADMVRGYWKKPNTEKQSKAISKILLRGDVSSLLDHSWSPDQIQAALADPAERARMIADLEAQLTGVTTNFYLHQIKGLAYHLTGGKVRVDRQLFNAANISKAYATDKKINAKDAAAEEPIIDQLITLWAIEYSSDTIELTRVNKLMETDRDGVINILKTHSFLRKQAMDTEFKGNEWNYNKGYTRETYNPYISIKTATLEEGKVLESAGYRRLTEEPLARDKADLDQRPVYMYSIRDGGLTETSNGFLVMGSKKAKGSQIHYGQNIPFSDGGINQNNARINGQVAAKNQKAADAQWTNDGKSFDPRVVTGGNKLAPTLDSKGQPNNYRYLMEDSTKDDVLDRETLSEQVLGKMAAALLEKERGPELNELSIDALYTDFRDGYPTNPKAFMRVDANSADPDVRAAWHKLPVETKEYVKQTFGMNGLLVRKTNYDLAFGYPKFSIGDAFQKDKDTQGVLANLMISAFGQLELTTINSKGEEETEYLGTKRALRLMQTEEGVQMIVKWVKDTWVIKNLFTLIGNESSNVSVLTIHGVGPRAIVKGKIEAQQATLEYLVQRKSMDELEFQVEAEVLVGDAADAAKIEITLLRDSLKKNIVADLMDEGLYQTLVEDLGQELDDHGYQARLTRFVDEKTSAVPDWGKTTVKWLTVSQGTPLYALLAQQTMLSDFTSRYVLYKHLTTRSKNKMEPDDAISRARKAFVNYDVPTHKGLQYLNDMGLVWFSKYYLRIQAVLIEMVREAPARALGVMVVFDWLFSMPDILDSSMFTKWPGNLGYSAFEAPGALEELITWQLAEYIID